MPSLRALALLALPSLLAACQAADVPGARDDAGAPTGEVSPTAAAPVTSTATASTPEPTASPSQAASEPCGADKARDRWLNALPTDEVKAAIAAAVGKRRIRYYGEGDMITMDFSEDRLSVVTGKDGRIKEFRCG